MKPRLIVIDGGRGSDSDPLPATPTWNREWIRGEHGGDAFITATSHVDVVNSRLASGVRVFVGGSRSITDPYAIASAIAGLPDTAVVLTSRTNGASAAAREAALARGMQLQVWSALTERFASSEHAYFARDEEMIRSAERVIAFWDGCSSGTAHELDFATQIGKPVELLSTFEPAAGVGLPRWALPLPLLRRFSRGPQPPDRYPGGDAA